MDLDSLENLAEPGEGTVVTAAVFPTQPPRESGDDMTLKEQALAGLPPEWRERLIADAGLAGVKHDQDVGWLLVGSVVHSAMAAFAAGNAADVVQKSIGTIPEVIYQGATRASGEVQGGLVAGSLKFAKIFTDAANDGQRALLALSNDQQAKILDAAGLGAEKIKNAATTLTATLDKAVEQKTLEGVQVFADAAAMAGAKMAKAAAASRFVWSVSGVAMLLIVFAASGAFIDHEYLSLAHRITPKPLVMSASGKPNCGQITGPGGIPQQVCQIM